MLEKYEVITVGGIEYVRKERFDEFELMFDAVCQSHTEFVNKMHAAVTRTRAALALPTIQCPECSGVVDVLGETIAGHMRDGNLCKGSYQLAHPPILVCEDHRNLKQRWRLADGREVEVTIADRQMHKEPAEFVRFLKSRAGS